jgi:hypothetical protein
MHLHRRAGLQVAQGARAASPPWSAQHRQGPLLYDYDRQLQLYEQPGGCGMPLAHERAFFPADEAAMRLSWPAPKSRQLLQLKGHKSVGGMRASIYNAMPSKACRRWWTTCENLKTGTAPDSTAQRFAASRPKCTSKP